MIAVDWRRERTGSVARRYGRFPESRRRNGRKTLAYSRSQGLCAGIKFCAFDHLSRRHFRTVGSIDGFLGGTQHASRCPVQDRRFNEDARAPICRHRFFRQWSDPGYCVSHGHLGRNLQSEEPAGRSLRRAFRTLMFIAAIALLISFAHSVRSASPRSLARPSEDRIQTRWHGACFIFSVD
jgi:hypothetical protein